MVQKKSKVAEVSQQAFSLYIYLYIYHKSAANSQLLSWEQPCEICYLKKFQFMSHIQKKKKAQY